MEKVRVLKNTYLEENKETIFYEYVPNNISDFYKRRVSNDPVYLGKYLNVESIGDSSNYCFKFNFEKGSLTTPGENNSIAQFILQTTSQKIGGKKKHRTLKIKKLKKSKKYKKTNSRR